MNKAPIQGEQELGIPPSEIPYIIYRLAYKEYARHHSQTWQRLAERGGLGWVELVACLRGEYTSEGIEKARKDLEQVVDWK